MVDLAPDTRSRMRLGPLLKLTGVALFAVLATIQVVRTAVVGASAERRAGFAAALWPEHPEVQRSIVMAEVGAAAALRHEPSPATLLRLERMANAAPLAVEPYLVQAAIALKTGHNRHAEELLVAARNRDPRSIAAHFLLADLYLRTGRLELGIAELALFSRFVPGAVEKLAPLLAQYSRMADALPQFKRMIAIYPGLEAPLLNQLATDTRNVDLILALATPRGSADEPAGWEQVLLAKLVEEGNYQRAYSVWVRLSRVSATARSHLFNPRFARSSAPPPFNWSLASGSDGVAEAQGEGLRVLYFGRSDQVLASQLTLLPPGTYRLGVDVMSQTDVRNVSWTVTCLPSMRQALELPLGQGRDTRSVSRLFRVAGDCAAQRFELKGFARDFAKTADFRIAGLRLARIGG